MAHRALNIVYASDLTIQDPSLLATLAVFYDKVWLPHAYDLDPDARPLMRWRIEELDDLDYVQGGYRKWKERWNPLFEAGVLEVLPPAFQLESQQPADLDKCLLKELGFTVPFFNSSVVYNGRAAIAMHALFAKTSDPEFLVRRRGATDTNHLRGTLATSLIQYRLPRIGEMTSEQLLRTRAETASDREGFVHYINQLTDDVEARLKATAGDEREAALRTIERKIAPEFEEHLSQQKANAERAVGKILKFFARGIETAVSVVTAPWNIKNYSAASELLLNVSDSLSESKLRNVANKHRAFQFLSSLEEEQNRLAVQGLS